MQFLLQPHNQHVYVLLWRFYFIQMHRNVILCALGCPPPTPIHLCINIAMTAGDIRGL